MTPHIAVLFDGAGLARLGLEQAGLRCTGFELNKYAHYLSTMVGSGNCILQDATSVDLREFDGVWCSPPCQMHSVARTQGEPESSYSTDYLQWCLNLPHDPLWVENVAANDSTWGTVYNAAQFTEKPLQNRNRVFGGRHPEPDLFREYRKAYAGVCPAILATEYKGSRADRRRASRYYGRALTLEECAYHQGFEIPPYWYFNRFALRSSDWKHELYRAIGNGVPVYVARAFGEAYLDSLKSSFPFEAL